MSIIDNFRNLPPVTKNLLIINVIIWLAMTLVRPLGAALETYGALYYFTSDSFIPTQLLTYMFLHANFWHLFFNMFALYMFGNNMERVLGSPKFLFYYLTCGIGAALVQEGVFAIMVSSYSGIFGEAAHSLRVLLSHSHVTYQEVYNIGVNPYDPTVKLLSNLFHTPTIGASGAIFGILLAFGFMFPNVRIYLLFPPVPMKAKVFVLIYAGVELLLGIYNNQADTVAHFAHLGGMLFGLLLLLYWRKKRIIGGPYF